VCCCLTSMAYVVPTKQCHEHDAGLPTIWRTRCWTVHHPVGVKAHQVGHRCASCLMQQRTFLPPFFAAPPAGAAVSSASPPAFFAFSLAFFLAFFFSAAVISCSKSTVGACSTCCSAVDDCSCMLSAHRHSSLCQRAGVKNACQAQLTEVC